MTKRIGFVLVVALVAAGLLFAAGTQEAADAAAGRTGEIDFSQFPDSYPEVPARVPASSYDYDDMSQSYEFEVLTYGYVVQPVDNNPITEYLSEQMNADITFTDVPGADLNQVMSVRFASGDTPDLIHLQEKAPAVTLADQAQLLDMYPYLEYVPQLGSYVTETLAKWSTYNGEWLGLPRYGVFADNWGLFIRGDWLDQFGMDIPEDTDDLYAYAKAIVEQDPNGNGIVDEWFMGTGGGGSNHFAMMEQLRSAFGHPGINVLDDEVNHPNLDGTNRAYLEWMNRLYSEGLLHPDWYTIEWEAFKSFTMTEQIGMVNYPGWNLIQEQYDAAGQDLDAARAWQGVPAPNSPTGNGGKLEPGGAPGGLFVFPRRMAQEEGKLLRILHFLDTLIYPNVNYWAAAQGGDNSIYPGQSEVVFDEETGLNVYNLFRDTHPAYADPNLNPLWNWQTLGYTLIWQIYNDPMGTVGSEWNIFQVNQPRHTNYELLVTVDNELEQRLEEFSRREEIAFVLGERGFDTWDTYVDEWLDRGGREMLGLAAQQLGVDSIE